MAIGNMKIAHKVIFTTLLAAKQPDIGLYGTIMPSLFHHYIGTKNTIT